MHQLADWLEHHMLSCWWKQMFGFECPGCGLQRALILLLHGDISASIRQHPGLIPFIVFFVWAVICPFIKYKQRYWVLTILGICTNIIFMVNYFLFKK